MKVSLKRVPLVAALVLAAALTVGVAAAGAHGGGPGGGGRGGGPQGVRGPSTSALVTEAAKQLGVSRSSLVAAIKKSANTQIDAAAEDEDIDAARASELK